MNINLNSLKQDYSFLFSNTNSSKNSTDLFSAINLSDYNSIKSGTYGKLLKAYYKKEDTEVSDKNSNKTNVSTESTSVQELKEVQAKAEELRDSASVLMQGGSKSVFKEEKMDKVYSTVSDFVQDFNSLVEKGTESDSKSIISGSEGLVTLAKDYEEEFKVMGITVDKNNQLVIDKDTFMNADIDKVKEVFNGKNSFAYLTSLRAVSIGNTAYSESNRSNLYTGDGSYASMSTGDVLNSII